MNDYQGFLHRHPKKEADLGIDAGHVIVDKKDWETVRMFHILMSESHRGTLSTEDDLKTDG